MIHGLEEFKADSEFKKKIQRTCDSFFDRNAVAYAYVRIGQEESNKENHDKIRVEWTVGSCGNSLDIDSLMNVYFHSWNKETDSFLDANIEIETK